MDGLSATVSVPMETTTGPVTLKDSLSTRETAPLQLQIVPDLLSFRVPPGELFNPGTVLTLSGSGFKEGNTTITFTGAASPVSATDVLQGNTGLSVVIPPGATGGPISVNTDGGVSEPVLGNTAALIGIVSTAVQGVPTDPIQASANIGQSVTLNGSGLTSLTYIFFTSFDFNGSLISTLDLPDSVAPDGQSLTILLPPGAISGLITVADHDTGLGSGSVNLQIVPTVDTLSGSLNAGSLLQVGGNGFEANTTQIQFPGVPLPVNPDNLSIDQRQLFFPYCLILKSNYLSNVDSFKTLLLLPLFLTVI